MSTFYIYGAHQHKFRFEEVPGECKFSNHMQKYAWNIISKKVIFICFKSFLISKWKTCCLDKVMHEGSRKNMKLLLNNMDELLSKTGYCIKKEYENQILNSIYNYCLLFYCKETEVIALTREPLEVILYNKYYWLTQYMKKYSEINGYDAGIEQQKFKLIEELDQRLENVDWDLLQKIDDMMEK